MVVGLLWTATGAQLRLAERLPGELAGEDLSISGWVDGFPREGAGQVSFSLRLFAEERARGLPGRLRLTWHDPPSVKTGSALELRVRLRAPRGLSNPGGFDYEGWLFREGYGATGYVLAGRELPEAPISFSRRWLTVCTDIADRIHAAVPDEDARALITALAIGERFDFDERHWNALRRTGTSHLVAISGLHVGLVAGFAFFLTRRVWLRLPGAAAFYDIEAAAVASLLCAGLYAAVAGFTLPTQRALVMLGVALLAVWARRSVSMAAGLSAALLFVLVWDPLAAVSASFWLSFIAVALLWQLGQSRPLRAVAQRSIRARMGSLARVQWELSLGLVPVVLIFFGEASLISPLVNFVAIPLFSLLLVPLTLAAAVGLYAGAIGSALLAPAGLLFPWVWWGLDAAAAWSWATVEAPEVGAGAMLAAVAAAMTAVCARPLRVRHLAWIGLIPLVVDPHRPSVGAFEATVLDVGHGLAVLVETRNHRLLYDAGPRYRSGFDAGREIVLPAMRALGWKHLDTLIVSHADNDHAGGAEAILAAFPGAQVYAGPDVEEPRKLACVAGRSWTWDAVDFEIRHPPEGFIRHGNDSSCVLKVSNAAGALLITGDIEAFGERTLLREPSSARADVVVVPHHGSATSSTRALVTAAEARYALVSAGYSNQWGFPRSEVTARWESSGARVITTGDAGAITLRLDSRRGLAVEARRMMRRRFWSLEAS